MSGYAWILLILIFFLVNWVVILPVMIYKLWVGTFKFLKKVRNKLCKKKGKDQDKSGI